MAKISMWRRVGGWLKHSDAHSDEINMVDLDSDNLIIPTQDESDLMDENQPLESDNTDNITVEATTDTHSSKGGLFSHKKNSLAIVEERFATFVEVLESMNNQLTEHGKQTCRINDNLETVTSSLSNLPENVIAHQRATREMIEELKNQSRHQQQLLELLQTLPESSKTQIEKLSGITNNLEASLDTQSKQLNTFNQFDSSMQGMFTNSNAQTESIANIGKMLEANDQQTFGLISKQNKKVTALLVCTIIMTILGLGTIGTVIYLFATGMIQLAS